MPKYTLSGEQAAIILPVTSENGLRKRLIRDQSLEITDAEHKQMQTHKVVKALIESGSIKVETTKSTAKADAQVKHGQL